jgi:hypothetical protein
VIAQTGAVTSGPLDGPGPHDRVVFGELHQLGIYDIDHLPLIGQTAHAFSPSPDGDVVPVRDEGSAGL